ncbi:DUF2283 domain-containing protein [Nodosilinea sp. LEGE 07298]|uniref:DUF2283 domain-containing protein n=1 Tax=Nodosilinea sp. LEGE 07298 TaxID=2777970 RepID=UPI0018809A23|nr:DUF2283 domain-containing protein [Nodosilinea sp. LEGE 07298]MBE9109925.1 DUF2283 domain-containing protein [Nodosilinea sp. LEGE 07298]
MDTLKIYYDEVGKTLTVWFGDPAEEFIAEETGEEVLLIKNQAGTVIGFERLNYELATGSNPVVELINA